MLLVLSLKNEKSWDFALLFLYEPCKVYFCVLLFPIECSLYIMYMYECFHAHLKKQGKLSAGLLKVYVHKVKNKSKVPFNC